MNCQLDINNCSCGSHSCHTLEIIQGTTPTLTLDVDMDLSTGYELKLLIKTRLNKVVAFDNKDLFVTKSQCGSIVLLTFTQEQTLSMNKSIMLQLSAKKIDNGMVYKTDKFSIAIVKSLDKEVM